MMIDMADIVWLVIVVAIIVTFCAPQGEPPAEQEREAYPDEDPFDGEPSVEERASAEAWYAQHRNRCELTYAELYYTFDRHNGIGVGVTARCSCGAYQDVTDYSTW